MAWFQIMKIVFDFIPVLAQIIKEILEALEKEPAEQGLVAKENLRQLAAQKDARGLKAICDLHGQCKK